MEFTGYNRQENISGNNVSDIRYPSFLLPNEILIENLEHFVRQQIKTENSYYLFPIKTVEELRKDYIFVEPERIKSFLFANIDLIMILLEAPEYIYNIFGRSVLIYLELHSDSEEEWDELFIVIKTNYSPEKAIELENKLFEEWFIEILGKIKGRLNFTEEPL